MSNDTLFYSDQDKWRALSKAVAERIIYLYKVPPKEHDDVYSNANIGLLKSLRQFDPEKCEQKNVVPYLYRNTFYKAINAMRTVCGRASSGKAKIRALTHHCLDTYKMYGYENQEFAPATLLTYDPSPATTEEEFRLALGRLNCLSEKQIEILTLYFYRGMLMRAIGKHLGLTHSRVSQIVNETKSLLQEAGYDTVIERLMQ